MLSAGGMWHPYLVGGPERLLREADRAGLLGAEHAEQHPCAPVVLGGGTGRAAAHRMADELADRLREARLVGAAGAAPAARAEGGPGGRPGGAAARGAEPRGGPPGAAPP